MQHVVVALQAAAGITALLVIMLFPPNLCAQVRNPLKTDSIKMPSDSLKAPLQPVLTLSPADSLQDLQRVTRTRNTVFAGAAVVIITLVVFLLYNVRSH